MRLAIVLVVLVAVPGLCDEQPKASTPSAAAASPAPVPPELRELQLEAERAKLEATILDVEKKKRELTESKALDGKTEIEGVLIEPSLAAYGELTGVARELACEVKQAGGPGLRVVVLQTDELQATLRALRSFHILADLMEEAFDGTAPDKKAQSMTSLPEALSRSSVPALNSGLSCGPWESVGRQRNG